MFNIISIFQQKLYYLIVFEISILFVLTNVVNFERHEKLNSTNVYIYVRVYKNRLTKYKTDQNKLISYLIIKQI